MARHDACGSASAGASRNSYTSTQARAWSWSAYSTACCRSASAGTSAQRRPPSSSSTRPLGARRLQGRLMVRKPSLTESWPSAADGRRRVVSHRLGSAFCNTTVRLDCGVASALSLLDCSSLEQRAGRGHGGGGHPQARHRQTWRKPDAGAGRGRRLLQAHQRQEHPLQAPARLAGTGNELPLIYKKALRAQPCLTLTLASTSSLTIARTASLPAAQPRLHPHLRCCISSSEHVFE